MKVTVLVITLAIVFLTGVSGAMSPHVAEAATAAEALDGEATAALNQLTASEPAARDLSDRAVAILVFPSVYKAGFVVGAQRGEGVLLIKGKSESYYSTTGASYGLQAGVQNTVTRLCL